MTTHINTSMSIYQTIQLSHFSPNNTGQMKRFKGGTDEGRHAGRRDKGGDGGSSHGGHDGGRAQGEVDGGRVQGRPDGRRDPRATQEKTIMEASHGGNDGGRSQGGSLSPTNSTDAWR